MASTVYYKGEVLTSVNNQTRTLLTSGKYMEDDVSIVDVTSSPSLESKSVTITPTESSQSQTVLPTSPTYDGLSSVSITVNPISPTYVGSGITRRDSTDLSVSGATVSVPSGYYESNETCTIMSGSATTPTTTISVTPTISIDSSGVITASVSGSQSVIPTVSPGYVSAGTAGTVSVSGTATHQLTVRDSSDMSVSGATVTAPAGYYPSSATCTIASGAEGTPVATKGTVSNHSISITPSVTNVAGYISGGSHSGTPVSVSASELVSGNLSISANGSGIDVTNYATVSVSVSPALRSVTKTYTPTESSQTETVTPGTGYDGLSSVAITVNAISPTYVGSGITRRSSSDLTVSGDTVSVPAGYYENPASETVASGTEGTPVATKGAVNNHSVSVTPSVSNTAGYISGGTRTGTAVTVSASELVSGSETKTVNGTYDVTNLAELVVNVPMGSDWEVDTKTITASSYPVSINFTAMKGQPKAFFLRSISQISSSGSTSYYYVIDMRYDGTSTTGNCFRIGSTRRVQNVTSGYSWSYSGTTLTVRSSASSRSSSPGAFNNTYELVYFY